MKKLIFLASALLLVFGTFSAVKGNSPVAPVLSNTALEDIGELPPPVFILVTNVTPHTITLGWTPVSGAVQYKVTAFDMDNGVALSSNILTAFPGALPAYTVTGLPMATNIRIGVSATSIVGGDFGEELFVYQQTDNIIIIDLVVNNSCTPGTGSTYTFNGTGLTDPLNLADNNQTSYTGDNREGSFKVTRYNQQGTAIWAVAANVVAKYCSNGSYKLICNPATGMLNTAMVTPPNNTAGELYFRDNTGATVLTIKDVLYNDATHTVSFRLLCPTLAGQSNCKFDNNCNVSSLSGNPCYTGTYGYAGTPPNKESSMAIHTNDIVDASNTSIADLYYNRDGSVAEQYRTADSRGNTGVNDENVIDLIPTEESLAVSPNPFNDFTNIQYQVTKQSPVSLTLYNAMGQMQKEILNDGNMAPGYYSLPMDVSDLQPGVYFLTIQTQSGRKITTVVKQ